MLLDILEYIIEYTHVLLYIQYNFLLNLLTMSFVYALYNGFNRYLLN